MAETCPANGAVYRPESRARYIRQPILHSCSWRFKGDYMIGMPPDRRSVHSKGTPAQEILFTAFGSLQELRMAVRSARLTRSRGLARGCHRPAAIERDMLKQAAMFVSPMFASDRTSDSTRTARHVRKSANFRLMRLSKDKLAAGVSSQQRG
jgi:hypothetical protein